MQDEVRPRRIAILGSAGSGKSTLARQIGERLGLPVIHLDVLFWEPGWTQPDDTAFRARVAAALAGDAWISEGNYSRQTFDLRVPRADQVIWMETPRLLCLWRVLVRGLRGGRRPDLPAGCEEKMNREYVEFLRYVWNFNRDVRPRIEAHLKAVGPSVSVTRLHNRADIAAYLETLPATRQAVASL
ncbi:MULTISPECIES: AAA family ATPase [unclassified Chelatococcus]|uniref:AAA family ATPase n=1 Tax=unclassified Chelatococcus TaxID=2638111 RepID=UPI001BCB76A1|nr:MULTISPECIES: AAA family ATPase [unclassified Chelatococcus]MBS7697761.1 AAA family ATPase [Chelatococcus sp. YT9]MBX3558382.1 AAA family ATPase [Chelatococcus sp.]